MCSRNARPRRPRWTRAVRGYLAARLLGGRKRERDRKQEPLTSAYSTLTVFDHSATTGFRSSIVMAAYLANIVDPRRRRQVRKLRK